MTTAQDLIDRSIPFLDEVKNRTTGGELETWLNRTYGPGSELYDDLARMITEGVHAGWAANVEVDGHKYRRGRIAEPRDAKLMGLLGWSGPGWTAPGPGSHHYPEVKGGALIALFYLPAGRISYDISAPA